MRVSEAVASSRGKLFDFKSLLPWLAFPVVISLSYWIVSSFYLSQYPFYLRVALRVFRDYVFLWLIKSISLFDFHPTYVVEPDPGSLQPSPLLGLLPYAASYRLFGDAGFVVADVVLIVASFLAFACFLRLAGARRHWACFMAVAAIAFAYVLPALQDYTNLLYAYSFRFPRPLVSQLFLLGCLGCLALQMTTDVGSNRYVKLSALYAVGLALLAQTDVYTTFSVIVAYALVLFWRIWQARGIALRRFATLAATGLISVVLCIPLFIQVAEGDASVQQRMGLFTPRDRLGIVAAYAADNSIWMIAIVFVALGAAALVLLWLARRSGLADRSVTGGLGLVPVLGLSALLGPPAFLLFSPAVAQIFHLKFVQVYLAILAVLIIGANGLGILAARFGWEHPTADARPKKFVTGGILAASIVATLVAFACMVRFVNLPPKDGYLPEFAFLPAAAPDAYRSDLTAVLEALGPLKRGPDTVLATNEQLVATWWVSERNGKVLQPDTFSTTLRTIDLDKRFVYFHQMLGTSKEEFRENIQRMAEMVYEQLYQATPSHTFSADLSDYSEEQQKIIRDTKWDHVWGEFVPISEIERLTALFDDRSLRYRVDIVVHQKSPGLPNPTPAGFVRMLDNANFSLWVRQP